jgi:hypothetical protein
MPRVNRSLSGAAVVGDVKDNSVMVKAMRLWGEGNMMA